MEAFVKYSMRFILCLFPVTLFVTLFVTFPVQASADQAVKTAVLPNLVRPRYVDVDHQRFYIVEARKRITGYAVDSLEKTFEIKARKGRGPGEYVYVPMVVAGKENVILKTTNKIAYYTRGGKYIRESKLRKIGVILPLDKNFLFYHFKYSKKDRTTFTVVNILDSKQKKIKQIYKYKAPKMNMTTSGGTKRGKYDLLRENLSVDIHDNLVYIADPSRGFFISIFDSTGKKIREISKDEPKIKITAQHREKLIKRAKYIEGLSDQKWKRFMKYNDAYHPEFFPSCEKIDVSGGKIYIKTYKTRDNKREFVILDLQGNELKRVFLADWDIWAIRDGNYFYLTFDDEEEEWSLNRAKITF